MKATLNIGGNPHGEPCVSVSKDKDYKDAMMQECRAYREALIKHYGQPPEGCEFIITSNPHDFGTYYEVEIKFDTKHVEYAYAVEEGIELWSDVGFKATISEEDGIVRFQYFENDVVNDVVVLDDNVVKDTTVKDIRDLLNKFPDDMLVRFSFCGEPDVYRLYVIQEGEIDGDLWVDTACDGPMGGEVKVVQIGVV